jgi:hypothetical protein
MMIGELIVLSPALLNFQDGGFARGRRYFLCQVAPVKVGSEFTCHWRQKSSVDAIPCRVEVL